MGWETRKGKRYLYIKMREGGRVVSQYVGAASALGEFHRGSELSFYAARRALERKRAAIRAEREEMDLLSGEVADLCDGIDAVMRASLLLAGYHQHDRGQWRKRRKGMSDGEG